jgi:hypothetical protein
MLIDYFRHFSVSCARLHRRETIQLSRRASNKIPVDEPEDNMILPRLIESKKSLLANLFSLLLLMGYAIFGGFMFLYFEGECFLGSDSNCCILEDEYKKRKHKELNERYECIDSVIRKSDYDAGTALRIIQQCTKDEEMVDWTFLNSLLYGFGILTTLGKIFSFLNY